MIFTTHVNSSARTIQRIFAVLGKTVLVFCLVPAALANEHVKVLTDLPVTHSLASMVMGDLGTPTLLVQGSASPHNYSLKPSQAADLQNASLIFWISSNLTPWLSGAFNKEGRYAGTNNVELMAAPQTIRFVFREHNDFNQEHDHEHHDKHALSIDPHGWLSPVNGIYWLELIAKELSELYPEHKEQFSSNAEAAKTKLMELSSVITEQLIPLKGQHYFVFHDSYHYFEEYFDIHATASIALGDTDQPSIRHMNDLRSKLDEFEQACIFSEPQFSSRLIKSLTRGLDVPTGSLDPLGANLAPGPDLYMDVLHGIANSLERCLKG